MIDQYRDIGILHDIDNPIDNFPLIPIEEQKTQVYLATHGEGGKRLPLHSRSFISFSYGGKNIEDFNLLATIQGNRIQKSAYSDFEDNVTTYDVVDGQFYWGTHYTSHQIAFSLATDGITEDQLNEFKMWFQPGQTDKELILAENPNRFLYARVSTPPAYALLPFEEEREIVISGEKYEFSTTLYKGEISLTFISDDPFWHSKTGLINYYYTDEDNKFGSITGIKNETTAKETILDKDFIKVIYEDRVPYIEMLTLKEAEGVIFGSKNFVSRKNARVGTDNNSSGAEVEEDDTDPNDANSLVGIILEDGDNTIELYKNIVDKFLFYGGTAPAATEIKFTLVPQIDENSQLIIGPLNSDAVKINRGTVPYNCFNIGNKSFKFTLPSLWNGYNQAILIASNFNSGESIQDLEDALRDGVSEYYSRAWAIRSLEVAANDAIEISNNIILDFKQEMYKLLVDENNDLNPGRFMFNSKTGEAIGEFLIRTVDNVNQITLIESKVGDMVRSDYLTLNERNQFSSDGKIRIENCTPISTDYEHLMDVIITFTNEYL